MRGRPKGSRNVVEARPISVAVRLTEDEAGWVASKGRPTEVFRGLIAAERVREQAEVFEDNAWFFESKK